MVTVCPVCGEAELEHWHMGVYECPECEAMVDLDLDDDDYEYSDWNDYAEDETEDEVDEDEEDRQNY